MRERKLREREKVSEKEKDKKLREKETARPLFSHLSGREYDKSYTVQYQHNSLANTSCMEKHMFILKLSLIITGW